MNPLQENFKENALPPLSGSKSGIVAQLQGTKDLVDGAIGKMREQQEILKEKKKEQEEMLLEKKRKMEGIILICEDPRNNMMIALTKTLKKTGDINATYTSDRTLLSQAVFFNYVEVVKNILTHPDVLVNEGTPSGFTALVWAAVKGNIEIVEELLKDPRIDIFAHNQLVKAYEIAPSNEIRIFLKQKLDFYGIVV